MPQINELTTRTFDGDSLIGFDVENTDPQTQAQYPYVTGKADGNAVSNFIANGQEYVTDLNTVDKHINGAINELHAINGYSYDAYDDTATYAVGDLRIHNNTLYKCTTAITTAEAWNASHWTATSIADEINELKSDKADKSDVDNNSVSITKINQSAFDLVATRRGHTVILTFDGTLPSGTYGDIWQCSVTPTVGVRSLVAWGSLFTLIDIDTNGVIKFRSPKTISENTYIGGELVFVTPS